MSTNFFFAFESSEMILITLLFLGLFGRSNLVVSSSCILLCLKYFKLDQLVFPVLESRGLELGLVLLMLHILSPVATEKLTIKDLHSVTSLKGLFALAAGTLATKLNGDGLALMNARPEIIFGLTVGTVLGILFLRGTPCGPVMAAAVTAVFLQIASLFS
ncbi:hypothetical membrane protein [Pelotomaculum thermopropionicum SI]|uniref:UPF0756 membrane protein PTH_1668 n=1 Tax=Pelotomaculum thermopropionicum (strain DSM 13744 / JCM 10971 / SI) TaxID=370438 RepID=Y1668_PELTS|nr:RecName: Full=UPF0756 membrane protein PTH_1668 [Pelotomaculum thermopropionicum SI]BAF59850.1 hypothetical membrane protein [Pelotomaculum thermopropionicum SI]